MKTRLDVKHPLVKFLAEDWKQLHLISDHIVPNMSIMLTRVYTTHLLNMVLLTWKTCRTIMKRLIRGCSTYFKIYEEVEGSALNAINTVRSTDPDILIYIFF